MANQNLQPPGKKLVNEYIDSNGNLVVETKYTEVFEKDANGNLTQVKTGMNIGLTTGEQFNSTYAAGPNPIIIPGLCALCERQRKRALTNSKHLRLCTRCGRPCCPQHRTQSSYDQKHRCPRCHRWHRLKLIIRTIFCERIEE